MLGAIIPLPSTLPRQVARSSTGRSLFDLDPGLPKWHLSFRFPNKNVRISLSCQCLVYTHLLINMAK
jgi:hypothetical protein